MKKPWLAAIAAFAWTPLGFLYIGWRYAIASIFVWLFFAVLGIPFRSIIPVNSMVLYNVCDLIIAAWAYLICATNNEARAVHGVSKAKSWLLVADDMFVLPTYLVATAILVGGGSLIVDDIRSGHWGHGALVLVLAPVIAAIAFYLCTMVVSVPMAIVRGIAQKRTEPVRTQESRTGT